jgi:hypothetical protein
MTTIGHEPGGTTLLGYTLDQASPHVVADSLAPRNGNFLGVGSRFLSSFASEILPLCVGDSGRLQNLAISGAFEIKTGIFSKTDIGWLAMQCRSHPSPLSFPCEQGILQGVSTIQAQIQRHQS